MSSDLPSPEFNSGSCTAFSGNVSLESYHLEQFLSLSMSFKTDIFKEHRPFIL